MISAREIDTQRIGQKSDMVKKAGPEIRYEY
jgi:hypothetical protein